MFQSYDPETGKINYTLQMSKGNIDEIVEKFDEHLAEGDGDYRTHYVDITVSPPILREKQQQQTQQDKVELHADGVELLTLGALPVPCVVTIGGERYNVDDGVLEWGTLRAGEYHITVEAVPFLTWESEVRAV